jgi:hypothetical protein
MGYPDLRIIYVDHPLGGIPAAAALAKTDAALAALVEFFES